MSLPLDILVTDDDAAVCSLMQRILEFHGYRVWTAHSAGEALNVVSHQGRNLRLLVTDVLMPDMSGPTLAAAVGQSFPDLRVLYVSGYCGEHVDRVPVGACLEKPFTPAQFLERVEALIAPVVEMAQV